MKVTYTQNRFEIDGVQVINPEVLPIEVGVNSWWKRINNKGDIYELKDGDSFDLPENIIAELDEFGECGYPCDDYKDTCRISGCKWKDSKVYRLKLKEPLVDTGSKETQEQIFIDLFQRLYDCLERGHGSMVSILSDFNVTRK